MPPLKLLWSNLITRRVRTALTVAAIALSVSLVVAVTSGYASVESAALAYLNRYLGSADAEISRPESTTDGLIPEQIDVLMSKDRDIHRATGRLDVSSNLFGKDGKLIDAVGFHIVGIRRPQDSRIDSLQIVSGQWFETSLGHVAVVDQVAAAALGVSVGDTFSMSTEIGRQSMLVVGIIHKPELMAIAAKTIYVPLETLQQFQKLGGNDAQVSRIAIDLQPGTDINAFAARWNQILADMDRSAAAAAGHPVTPMKLRLVRQDRSRMDLDLRSVHVLSYLGDAISLLAATFIIFSSLAMGVSERQRALAMLRAIGATRAQVAGLVIFEGLLLTAAGAVVGVPLGIFWTECLRLLFYDFFVAGITISLSGIALGVGGALLVAIGASLLPAWTASRTTPLEAMSPLAKPPPAGPPLGWTVLGLLLICIDPAIFGIPWEKLVARFNLSAAPEAETNLLRFYAHHTIGAEGLFFGFFLLAPMLIWTMERFLAPVVAMILRLPPALLRQQLSHGLWRAAGAGGGAHGRSGSPRRLDHAGNQHARRLEAPRQISRHLSSSASPRRFVSRIGKSSATFPASAISPTAARTASRRRHRLRLGSNPWPGRRGARPDGQRHPFLRRSAQARVRHDGPGFPRQ
jgi:putative ABC transport system permease protein